MSLSVLMVCEGNLCRSPMAAALLKKAWSASADATGAISPLVVGSAGTRAQRGCRADMQAVELMAVRGVDLRAHASNALSVAQVNDAQLILTMTRVQRGMIEAAYPYARGKVYRLGEHDRLDIVDPYRRGRFIFELAVAQIEQGVSRWLRAIAGLRR